SPEHLEVVKKKSAWSLDISKNHSNYDRSQRKPKKVGHRSISFSGHGALNWNRLLSGYKKYRAKARV
ncbi:unnamed protein product, partial [marine sediment metagenome]